MSEQEDRIIATGEDGKKYYLPRQSVDVRPVDWKARALAIGGLLVGAGAIIYESTKSVVVQPVGGNNPGIVQTVESMQTQQALNNIGDCVNENVLRGVMRAPLVNLEVCATERSVWATQASEAATQEAQISEIP